MFNRLFDRSQVNIEEFLIMHPSIAQLSSSNSSRPLKVLLQCVPFVLASALPAAAMDLPSPISDADFHTFDAQQVALGQLLFYDKILSGNENIACATCHHHSLNSADGLSLGIGEGGVGLGTERTAGAGADEVHARVPRNAPALWNLAHKGVESVFHDGRLSIGNDFGNGFNSPARENLPTGLATIIAAQALFPPTSDTEMAGQSGENDVADATEKGMHLVWPILAKRVGDIPEYADLSPRPMTM